MSSFFFPWEQKPADKIRVKKSIKSFYINGFHSGIESKRFSSHSSCVDCFFAFLCYSFHILLFYSHKPLEINVVQLYSFWETENDVQNCWLVLVFMIMLLSKEEMQLSSFKFYDIIAV